jgi:hypothetical protein
MRSKPAGESCEAIRMDWADLFKPPVRKVRKVENQHSILNGEERKTTQFTGAESGTRSSTSSAEPIIPLDAPFREGCTYRMAAACDVRKRLALYIEDEVGPWLRRPGVLQLKAEAWAN